MPRGKINYHKPFSDPDVSIGLTLSFSPTAYEAALDDPLYLVVTGRILKSPQTSRPITFATSLNPFDFIGDRSFENIICTYPETAPSKHIEIWPRSHFSSLYYKNVRDCWKFLTIEPGKPLEVKHQVPVERIRAAGLEKGERYKTKITDIGLGTSWWMFGTLADVEGCKFKRWTETPDKPRDVEIEGEPASSDEVEDDADWVMGEEPQKLAMIIEKGEAEFEVV